MKYRFILDVILFIVILHGWWFIALPIALIGMIKFEWFFEMLIAGIAYDSLFGLVSGQGTRGSVGAIVSLGIFFVMILLRKVMRK